ncbi:MAG TPA: GNAT N-acetyltransferase [Candidatus Stackebrandtia excrementipullorum]|nr:GNAT N-acetyltransferase [Candidatus Stackebrandtia excrementipullorum]
MEPVQLTIEAEPTATGEAEDRLRLRMPRVSDLPRIAEMSADEAVVANTLVPVPWTAADGDAHLDRYRRSWDDGWPRWVIAGADDDVLGAVGLRPEGFGAEIVYQTAPWARRRGVAVRACHAALRYAFDELSVHRISWSAITGNHVSRLVALRLGFTMEGIRRHGVVQRGEPVDAWTAALLPGELRKPSEPPVDYALWRQRAGVFSAPQPRLATALEHVALRPLTDDDVDRLTATGADPVTRRWTTVPRPYRTRHSVDFVNTFATRVWRLGTGAVFAVVDADDLYCGTIEIRLHDDDPRRADIGCITAPWSRGHGYMTAATKALCRYGFDVLGVERIEWHAHVGNEASIRVATKAGFVAEGVARAGAPFFGEHRDLWQGAVLADDLPTA